MADLATLTARRDALEKQMAAGTLSVKVGEKEITYRSMADMEAALARLNRAIAGASGQQRVHSIRIASSKGL